MRFPIRLAWLFLLLVTAGPALAQTPAPPQRPFGQLDVERETPCIAEYTKPRGRARLPRGDFANELFVRADITPFDVENDVVGVQPGALCRRSVGHVLHQRSARGR